MKIEKEIVEETSQPFLYAPQTALGKRLVEIRAKIIASGEPLLDWDGVEKEIADRRGEHESGTR